MPIRGRWNPVANEMNPMDIVKAGSEIKAYMEKLKSDRESQGKDYGNCGSEFRPAL